MSRHMNADAAPALEPCEVFAEPSGKGDLVLRLVGAWTLGNRIPPADEIRKSLESTAGVGRVAFDSEGLSAWDSGFLTFLLRLMELGKQGGIAFEVDGEGDCQLDVRWSIVDQEARRVLVMARSSYRKKVGPEGGAPEGITGYEAVAAAMSRNVADLGRDIATKIKALSGQ